MFLEFLEILEEGGTLVKRISEGLFCLLCVFFFLGFIGIIGGPLIKVFQKVVVCPFLWL